jgi:excinuclease UvrABC nuclease subunit
LREVALLRELRPPCNTRGVGGGRRFLKLTNEPYPRLLVVPEPVDDGADYYGPIQSERRIRLAVDTLQALYPIRTCHARCAGGAQARLPEQIPSDCRGPCSDSDVDAYRQGIDDVRRLLDADQGAAVAALLARLAEHV